MEVFRLSFSLLSLYIAQNDFIVLKEGIAKFLKLDSLMENVTGYVETRLEIVKYDLKQDLAKVLSKASVLLLVAMAGIFFLLFLSVALAFELGTRLGNFAGFGIVSLLYILTAVIIYLKRDSIGHKIETGIKEVIKQKKN